MEKEARIELDLDKLEYHNYEGDHHLDIIMDMIKRELSEPYPIFTYRYFVKSWPDLTYLIYEPSRKEYIGWAVSKLESKKIRDPIIQSESSNNSELYVKSGYLAMLAVKPEFRGNGLGKILVKKTVNEMEKQGADEVVLETEVTNLTALSLYEGLGFIREKRLNKYYLNGNDAFKLVLSLKYIE